MNTLEQTILRSLPPRIRQIVTETADEHDVRIYSIFSTSRRKSVVMARWAAMYQVKAGNMELSAPTVGKWFGRDGTTVLRGWARYASICGLPRLEDCDISTRVVNQSLYHGMQL